MNKFCEGLMLEMKKFDERSFFKTNNFVKGLVWDEKIFKRSYFMMKISVNGPRAAYNFHIFLHNLTLKNSIL